MAKKTDFSEIRKGRVTGALEAATSTRGQQGTASKEEAAERAATGKTQGRKGCKAVRINMAFWTDNYNFIKYGARRAGMTMTEFCNYVIENFRDDNPDAERKANEAREEYESLTADR